MSCNNCDKNTLEIMQGTKGREIYITVKGLDWDLTNPPSGYQYQVFVKITKPDDSSGSENATIVNSNTVKFTLDSFQSTDTFYDTGMYSLKLWVDKLTDPGLALEQRYVIEVDTCIYIYDDVNCTPPGCL